MKITLSVLATLVLLGIYGCSRGNSEVQPPSGSEQMAEQNPDQNSVIGDAIGNPYSVSIMRQAYNNLKPQTRSMAKESDIVATHLYIVFKPTNIDELNAILAQTDLELYQHPLDREISDGWSAVDPEYSINDIQHRWCSVPVDYPLSEDCPYQIIEELYLPDDWDAQGNNLTRAAEHLPKSFIKDLVIEAHNICGIELKPVSATRGAEVFPSGRVIAWDAKKGAYVGNEGMKVRATRMFKTATGFCDANGYYRCDKSFEYEFDYHLHFGRDDFELRENNTSEIVYNKHNMRGPWNHTFTKGSKEAFWSTAFRAAFYYYYKEDINQIRRPPQNSFWKAKLTLKMHPGADPEGTNGSFTGGIQFLGITSAISIYKQSSPNFDRPTDGVYGTVIHEIAHASHWNFDSDNYKRCRENGNKIVLESWARGVQWQLTQKIYPDYNIIYDRCRYTGMIEDLRNGTKTVKSYYWWSPTTDKQEYGESTYKDEVLWIPLNVIENCLIGSSTWNQWRDRLKQQSPSQAAKLDNTFRYWNSRTY